MKLGSAHAEGAQQPVESEDTEGSPIKL